jgi:septal ring factor EnvC (AmiA/AmiB activator)
MSNLSPVAQLESLNRRIEQMRQQASGLEKREKDKRREARTVTRRLLYLQAARRFRRPIASYPQWPTTALIVAPAIGALVGFVLADLTVGTFALRVLGLLAGAAALLAAAWSLLNSPGSDAIDYDLTTTRSKRELVDTELREISSELAATQQRLQQAVADRQQLVASDKLERAMLLQRPWKEMRADEWEDYLVEVCRTLGAKVERTGRVGDQGVDLIVEFGERRTAVQAKGYYHTVNARAVQEAVAGMAHYKCNASAVITNSRFTNGARELAESNHCHLIGLDEFPSFVMGELAL